MDTKNESTILITGGAGFIGSALINFIIKNTNHKIVNIDKLTYASSLSSLESISKKPNYTFYKEDITNASFLNYCFEKHMPQYVIHLAAESHVDKSINNPNDFIITNIIGTYTLLESIRKYWISLSSYKKGIFRLLHVSTDEVYGSLGNDGLFSEKTPYDPSSPYSASKASSDHLVRAWNKTYKIPAIITNCSNNYGYYQHPEKLIPLTILNSLTHKEIPIYGDGNQIRDWLFVEDHVKALLQAIKIGVPGETYNIGGNNEKRNIDVVTTICNILDKLIPIKGNKISSYKELIVFSGDRPGHDIRYGINARKAKNDLSWEPLESFESGILKTVKWYFENIEWCISASENKNHIDGVSS